MRDHQRRGAAPDGDLPLEPDAFVGRSTELRGLARALDAARLVTVTGPGGIGKSRLAARAAAAWGARARGADSSGRAASGGWRRVELAPLRDPEFVDHAVVEALGLTDQTARHPREALRAHLAGRELLLVVDGFEHLAQACAELVADLLGRLPELRVLAVGRCPLRLAGERLFPLAPLAEDEAVELFAERARGQGVTVADDADVRELCRRLDGIPLSVELAAGRLRALSPRQLLERVDDRFRLLAGGVRDALPRHRALRTAIGWSHELCTPAERMLWARLSVFAGQFDLEAVEYVCSGHGLHADDVLEVLAELIAQSVVTRVGTPAGVRYRMLDTIRAYGADWLEATGDAARLRSRHRDWYVGLATWCELDWFSPRQAEVAARVETELPNLRSALEHCLSDPGEAHLGQYLAGSLWFVWVGCGRLPEGRYWLERSVGLEAERTANEQSRLKALWVLGYVAILQGDTVPALAALTACRDGAEHFANPTAAAYAEHRSGCLALVRDDMGRAETLLRSALERYREIGELNSNVLMGQVELAMARAFLGDLPEAVRLCEGVRRTCDDHGERWARAYALFVLGYAAWAEGELGRARTLLSACLSDAHGFRDLLGSVLAVELLALVTVAEGDPVEAAVLQGAASRMWPSVGLPLFGSAHFNVPHELCEKAARGRLGDERYEECVGRGRLLGHEAAVARALGRERSLDGLPAPRGPHGRTGAGTREPTASRTRKGGETAG
ncbi:MULTISPECIES: AAA family ATPase [unclassified Streptomyces]|uniref:ATP-binding protein n=1 Tax=unclassified Streptomyces TaxID=2593676 RepID=UPI001F03380B|nr:MULTISPECIES: AAA family ATPase [unclassified Streptomyces]MCH0564699.1 AAA family ATPase [Streptomyces sp. MUM 2J]MCH0569186.1 AAA family ATPase [Streptomyces sp. MUM 136J]